MGQGWGGGSRRVPAGFRSERLTFDTLASILDKSLLRKTPQLEKTMSKKAESASFSASQKKSPVSVRREREAAESQKPGASPCPVRAPRGALRLEDRTSQPCVPGPTRDLARPQGVPRVHVSPSTQTGVVTNSRSCEKCDVGPSGPMPRWGGRRPGPAPQGRTAGLWSQGPEARVLVLVQQRPDGCPLSWPSTSQPREGAGPSSAFSEHPKSPELEGRSSGFTYSREASDSWTE